MRACVCACVCVHVCVCAQAINNQWCDMDPICDWIGENRPKCHN